MSSAITTHPHLLLCLLVTCTPFLHQLKRWREVIMLGSPLFISPLSVLHTETFTPVSYVKQGMWHLCAAEHGSWPVHPTGLCHCSALTEAVRRTRVAWINTVPFHNKVASADLFHTRLCPQMYFKGQGVRLEGGYNWNYTATSKMGLY